MVVSTYYDHRFKEGKFTVKKTQQNFSCLAMDHAHEQNNKTVKGDGGVIGLTENSAQLLKWILSGPEMARLIKEFKDNIDIV